MSMTLLLALSAAMPEVPTSAVQVVQDGEVYIARNLIDNNPLYTFDRDEPGKSNCTAACAEEWRPLWAPAGADPVGKWTLVKRDDGSSQWAYAGKPVYSFAQDPRPVTIADGRVGNWQLLPTFPAR
jgi:predicted lipoprotein with Yx(FWY)xxD motif